MLTVRGADASAEIGLALSLVLCTNSGGWCLFLLSRSVGCYNDFEKGPYFSVRSKFPNCLLGRSLFGQSDAIKLEKKQRN